MDMVDQGPRLAGWVVECRAVGGRDVQEALVECVERRGDIVEVAMKDLLAVAVEISLGSFTQ